MSTRSWPFRSLVRESKARGEKHPPLLVALRQQWLLYVMMLPAVVLLILFRYYPLWGIGLAFVKYSPFKGLSGSEWVGLENFRYVFTMREAWPIFRNTLCIAIGKILVGTVTAIAFALTLHQVRVQLYKRMVQTATTLPHFLSWVIIGGIMVQILSGSGTVNVLLRAVGLKPIKFLGSASVFPFTLIISETWKEFGFGAVIYLAALTAINPDLYEAAAVDGAGRWARLWHITIPGISGTIVLLSCLNLGNILSAGFDQILVLINPVVYSTGEVLDTWVYRVGLIQSDYSLATAVGLLRSVVGLVLILLSYWLADRFANYRIF